MKKQFIRIVSIFVVMLFICQFIVPICKYSMAATSDENILLTSKGVTITKSSTVSEVTQQYGSSPKLTTESAFGGYTYTYYKGEYEDVLYIETDEKGVIVSYGALSDDFTSTYYSYGETDDYTTSYLAGTIATAYFSDKVTGVITYRQDLMTSQRVELYCQEFMSNDNFYEKNYAKHAVIMLNHYLHSETDCEYYAEFDEEIYDTVKKIEENGKSIDTYAEQNGKTSYYKYAKNDFGAHTLWSELPNPLRPVNSAKSFYPTEDKKYAFLDYNMYEKSEGGYGGVLDGYYFDKRFIEKNDTSIALTNEEITKYNNAKECYLESVNTFNQNGEDGFEEEPNYQTTPLVAGKIKENKLEGSTGYLNAIRLAAGLGKVTHSSAISNAAQHKAVLISYFNYNLIPTSNPHYPDKPAEVDQEFYNECQKYMNENLYSGNIISSIANAINDGNGDPISAGHRYNLLRPGATTFGIGYANGQSVHKLDGYGSYDQDAVAWPSIGITPLEAYNGGYWTCRFYKNSYYTTENTQVNVKCLNSNEEWNFVTQTTSGNMRYKIASNQVSFYNPDMPTEDGYVYSITIKNVQNNDTNKIEDFTYRTVFKGLYNNTNIVYPESVSLDKTEVKAVQGAKFYLNTTFTKDSTEIRTIWSSSNTNVATVDQYGQVSLVGSGSATITVKTLNGKTAQCKVLSVSEINGLKIEKDQYNLKATKYEKINVTETSGIIINNKDIKWEISDDTKATITKSVLTGLAEGEVTITATYKGKTATTMAKILPRINMSPTFKLRTELALSDLLAPGKTTTINVVQSEDSVYLDYLEFDFIYDTTYLEYVKTDTVLDGLTVSKVKDGVLHFYYKAEEGQIYKIKDILAAITIKAKEDCLYAKNSFELDNIKYHYLNNTQITDGVFQYLFSIKTANAIKGISLSETDMTITVLGFEKSLKVTFDPSENIVSEKITWTSSNSSVAPVDSTGRVEAKSKGTAIITATTESGKTATCKVTVDPIIIISSIKLNKTSLDLNIDGSYDLVATITPSNTTQSKVITWTSSDSSVATVDSTGKVTAKKAGTATITATTSNGRIATCKVTVSAPITGITLNKTDLTLNVGDKDKLSYTIEPENTTSSKDVQWISSNTNIVKVDSSGNITAVSEGEANIVVWTSKYEANAICKVTVKKKDTIEIISISLSKTEETLRVGDTKKLNVTYNPSVITADPTITWTSTDNNIVSVDANGYIKGNGPGTATITATTKNGKTATCKVTVSAPITGITLNKTDLTLKVGDKEKLSYTIEPENTTSSKDVQWISSNTSIVNVDSSGNITAVSDGEANVTVWTSKYEAHSTCKVTVKKKDTVIKPITGITLNKTVTSINLGDFERLVATINPTDTTDSDDVTWTTSNSNIATVDSIGTITPKAVGKVTITATTVNGKTATCEVTINAKASKIPSVSYRTHVENDGWQNYVKNGEMAGTSGRCLRLEGINIKLEDNIYGGGISYRTHVQDIGWQNFVSNNEMAGTSGRCLRLEGIEIKLTGEIANYYDVYYRVHAENLGWLDWAKNGQSAGSAGYSYRLEAIQIKLIKKGDSAPGNTSRPFAQNFLRYQTHVQDDGWQGNVPDGETSGTSGRCLRLEGIRISLRDQLYDGNIEYKTHVENIGWQNYVKNGEMSGTSGKALRLEAIQIRLTGTMAEKYDIYYRVHAQEFGWMGWAKNGQSAGTAGYCYRLEAIQISIVEKGTTPPGSTSNCFISK